MRFHFQLHNQRDATCESPGRSPIFTLFFGNQSLNQANLTKFLGIYVVEHLTWKRHISFICKRVSKSVGIIFRSSFYLPSKTN